MQIMSERREGIGDAAIGPERPEEGKDGRSDARTTSMEIEPLKIKTLADLIGVCREKGYQVYNNKPNIPETERIRTETLGEQSGHVSKKHRRDDRNPNFLGRTGRFISGESSIKAGVDRKSVMTDLDSNNVASRMTSAWSSYYSRSQATSLLSKQTECDPLADAEEVLQQRIRKQSKRRREKRPGSLVDLMIQMSLQRDNTKIANEPNNFTHTDTTVVSPATTGSSTEPVNVTKSPGTVKANCDKTKLDKTKGSNPISDASPVVSNRGKAQANNKSISKPLQIPKTNNVKNEKGDPVPKSVEKVTRKKMSQAVSKEKLQNSDSQNHALDKQSKANQNNKFAQNKTNIKTGDKQKTVQDHSSTEKENSDHTGEIKAQIMNSLSKNKEDNIKESPQNASGINASNDSEKELKGDKKQKSSNVALNSEDDTCEAVAAVGGQHSENTVRDNNISEMVERTENTTASASYENISPQQTGTPLKNEDEVMKHVDNLHSDSSVQQATENNNEKVLDEVRIKDGNSTLVLYKVKEQSLLNLGKSSKDVTWNQEKGSQKTEVKVNPQDSVCAKTDETNESKEISETKNKSDETKSTKCSPSKKNKLTSKANKKSETLSKEAQLILIIEKVKKTNDECSDLHMKTINIFEEARKSFRNQDTFDEPETETKGENDDKHEDTGNDEHETEPEEETIGEDGKDQTPEPDDVQDSEMKEELEPKVESPPNKKKETKVEQYFIYRDPTLDTTSLPEDNVYIVEAKRIYPQGIDLMENKSGARQRTGKYAVKHVNSKYADIFSSKNEIKVALAVHEKNKPVKRNFKRVGSVPLKSAGPLNAKSKTKQEVIESKVESKNDHRGTVKQITFPSVKIEPVTASSSKTGEKINKVIKQANDFNHEIECVFENKINKNITSKNKTVRCRNGISKMNSHPKFVFKTYNTCRSASFSNRKNTNVEDANANEKEEISGHQTAVGRTSREKLSIYVPNSEESRATLTSGKSDTSISAAVEIVHSRTSFYKGMLSNGQTNAPRGRRVHKLFREIQRIRRQVTSYPGPTSSLGDPCNFLDIDRDSGFLFANYSEPGGCVTKQKTNSDLNKFLYGDYGVYSKDKSTNSNHRRRVKALESLKQKM